MPDPQPAQPKDPSSTPNSLFRSEDREYLTNPDTTGYEHKAPAHWDFSCGGILRDGTGEVSNRTHHQNPDLNYGGGVDSNDFYGYFRNRISQSSYASVAACRAGKRKKKGGGISGSSGTPFPSGGSGSGGTSYPTGGDGGGGRPFPSGGDGGGGRPFPSGGDLNGGITFPSGGDGGGTTFPSGGDGSGGRPFPDGGDGSNGTPFPAGGDGSNGRPFPSGGDGSNGTPIGSTGNTDRTAFGQNSGETSGDPFGESSGVIGGTPIGQTRRVTASSNYKGNYNPTPPSRPIINYGSNVVVKDFDGENSESGGTSLSSPSTSGGISSAFVSPKAGGRSTGSVVSPSAVTDEKPAGDYNDDTVCDFTRYKTESVSGTKNVIEGIYDAWYTYSANQYNTYSYGSYESIPASGDFDRIGWHETRTGSTTSTYMGQPYDTGCPPPSGAYSGTKYISYGNKDKGGGSIVTILDEPYTRGDINSAHGIWLGASATLKNLTALSSDDYGMIASASGGGWPTIDTGRWLHELDESDSACPSDFYQTSGIKVSLDLVTRQNEPNITGGSPQQTGHQKTTVSDLIGDDIKYVDYDDRAFGVANAMDSYPMNLSHFGEWLVESDWEFGSGLVSYDNDSACFLIKMQYVSTDGKRYRITVDDGTNDIVVHTMVADAEWGFASPFVSRWHTLEHVTLIEIYNDSTEEWDEVLLPTEYATYEDYAWGLFAEGGWDEYNPMSWALFAQHGAIRYGDVWGFTQLLGSSGDRYRQKTFDTDVEEAGTKDGIADAYVPCKVVASASLKYNRVYRYNSTSHYETTSETITVMSMGRDQSPDSVSDVLRSTLNLEWGETSHAGGVSTATEQKRTHDPASGTFDATALMPYRDTRPNPHGKEMSRQTVTLLLTYGDDFTTINGDPPKQVYSSGWQSTPSPAEGTSIYVENARYCPA